jgi:hypothetical protein
MLTPKQVREQAVALLDVAHMLGTEGEGMTIDDEMSPEDMSQVRSYLSSMRRNVDIVSKALAMKWVAEGHDGYVDHDSGTLWYVGKPKGKKVVDPDMFFQWLATKDAEELKALFNPNAVKVGGMNEAERSTHLDERPTAKDVSLMSKPV